jgi:hypothetical protein
MDATRTNPKFLVFLNFSRNNNISGHHTIAYKSQGMPLWVIIIPLNIKINPPVKLANLFNLYSSKKKNKNIPNNE